MTTTEAISFATMCGQLADVIVQARANGALGDKALFDVDLAIIKRLEQFSPAALRALAALVSEAIDMAVDMSQPETGDIHRLVQAFAAGFPVPDGGEEKR